MRPACCLAKSESEDILPGAQGTGARGPAAQIPPWAWLKDCMPTFILYVSSGPWPGLGTLSTACKVRWGKGIEIQAKLPSQ